MNSSTSNTTPPSGTSPSTSSRRVSTSTNPSKPTSTTPAIPSPAPIYHHSPTPAIPSPSFQSALQTGTFTDLTITHGSKQWFVHKVIIGAQSPYLQQEILECIVSRKLPHIIIRGRSQIIQTPSDQAESFALRRSRMPRWWDAPPKLKVEPAVLDLSSDPLSALDHTISFLYTFDYTIPSSPPPPDLDVRAILKMHISVFNLACKYQIPSLQSLAAAKFTFVMNTELTDISVFFDLVTVIYSDEDGGTARNALKKAVTEAAVQEMRTLLGEGTRIGFMGLLSRNLEFLKDVLEMMKIQAERGEVVGGEERGMFLCEDCAPKGPEGEIIQQIAVQCRGCGEVSDFDV